MKARKGIAVSPQYNFSGGLVTAIAKTQLAPSQLIKASNINILVSGEIELRGGYSKVPVTEVAFGTEIDRFIHLKTPAYDKLIAYGGASVKRLDKGTPDVWTTLASDMPDTENYRSMVIGLDRLYIASASGVKKYYPGQAGLWNAGIVAPGTATVAAEGTAGNLSGTYRWYYTYYNSVTGEEGDPAPISNELTVTDKRVNLTVVASTDPQVDKIRFYRNPAGVSNYYYIGEMANGTNWEDNVHDDNISADGIEFTNAPPPAAKILLWHMNRMFYVDANNPHRLYWSEPFKPGSVPAVNYLSIEEDGGEIVAAAASYENLVVFKTTGIFYVIFNGLHPLDSDYVPLSKKYSCVAPMSAQHIRGDIIFLSNEGLKLITNLGETVRELHVIQDIDIQVVTETGQKAMDPISTLLRACRKDIIHRAVGAYYEPKNQYHLSLPYYSGATNNLTLVWNIDSNTFVLHEGFNVKAANIYQALNDYYLYRSHNDQYIYKHDHGFQDEGQPISWEAQSGWHSINDIPDYKKVTHAIVSAVSEGGGNIGFELLKDFGIAGGGVGRTIEVGGAAYWGSAHWGQDYWGLYVIGLYRYGLKTKGRVFSTRFYGTNSAKVGVSGYQFLYQAGKL